MYKAEREGFVYDKEKDEFTCSMGKTISFKRFDRNSDGRLQKSYRASRKDCMPCVLKESCTPNLPCKRIQTTAYDEPYRRAHDRQQSKQGHRMKKLRQSAVEQVFGSLVFPYGLKKINVIGKAGAPKVMLMATTCFILKKYLKSIKRKTLKSEAMEALKSYSALISAAHLFSLVFPNNSEKTQKATYVRTFLKQFRNGHHRFNGLRNRVPSVKSEPIKNFKTLLYDW